MLSGPKILKPADALSGAKAQWIEILLDFQPNHSGYDVWFYFTNPIAMKRKAGAIFSLNLIVSHGTIKLMPFHLVGGGGEITCFMSKYAYPNHFIQLGFRHVILLSHFSTFNSFSSFKCEQPTLGTHIIFSNVRRCL